MTSNDPLTFLILNPAGMLVRGQHNPASPPVHPLLADDFANRHAAWRERVLARPGGFDGARAVLEGFHYERGTLNLRTAYRGYSEGLALRDSLRHAREHGTLTLPAAGAQQPQAEISWGMSLTCYILLPQNYVLCAQRDPRLISQPGIWTCSHTEVMEPSDINAGDMQPLLERLVAEELPALTGLGTQTFVGLSLRKNSYGWQLVALIDLRLVEPDAVVAALLALRPDAETAAWAVCSLEPTKTPADPVPYPETMRRPAGAIPGDFDIAYFLNREVSPC